MTDCRTLLPGWPRTEVAQQVRELVEAGQGGDAVELYQREVIGIPGPVADQIKASPMWPDLVAIAPSLVYEGLIVCDPELPKLPPTVPVPTLVIGGESGVAPRSGRQTAEQLPQGRYHALPDQTHDIVPDVVAPIVADYLGGLRSVD